MDLICCALQGYLIKSLYTVWTDLDIPEKIKSIGISAIIAAE